MTRKTVSCTGEILAVLQRLTRPGERVQSPPPDFFKQFAPLHAIHRRFFSNGGSSSAPDGAFKRLARPRVRRLIIVGPVWAR